MEQSITLDRIYGEILSMKRELDYIKEHMVDIDLVLTPNEEAELDESLKDLEEGKAFSLEDIKKDRENA